MNQSNMKAIILRYKEGEFIDELIRKTLKFECSSKVSLVRRSLINYCQTILNSSGMKNEKLK